MSNQKHNQQDNQDLRRSYCETLKEYKHTLRTNREQHINSQLTVIEESLKTNNFWDNWNSLNKSQHDELAIQNGDIWRDHYEKLYNKIIENTEQKCICKKLENLELAIKDFLEPTGLPNHKTRIT